MYFNTLIIMNEDTPGYGRRSRRPSGYCKLSVPNRVICYVQGLQQLPKGQAYRIYLMSQHKQKSVEIGMFQVGMSGNKELRWTMTPGDINNSGLTAQEIDGALIKVDGEGVKDLTVPLVGFSASPYLWKSIVQGDSIDVKKEESTLVEKLKPAEEAEKELVLEEPKLEDKVVAEGKPELENELAVKEKPEPEEELVVKEKSEPEEELVAEVEPVLAGEPVVADKTELGDKPILEGKELPEWQPQPIIEAATRGSEIALRAEVVSLEEEIQRLNKIIGQSNRTIESLQEELAAKVSQPEPPKLELSKSELAKADNTKEVAKPQKDRDVRENLEAFIRSFQEDNKRESNKHTHITNTMNNIFEKRIPMNPFPDADDEMKWVRITHEDLLTFSQLPTEWANQLFILEADKHYKHLILGRDKDGLTYYVGIPGVFNPEKSDILDRDRIERFRCRRNVPLKAGEVGYWIALM